MRLFIFLRILYLKVTTLNANKNYQDYKSIWRNKSRGAIEAEIHVINNWSYEIDKYLHKEAIKSEQKIEILNGLLGER
jgi:hypothetical protein